MIPFRSPRVLFLMALLAIISTIGFGAERANPWGVNLSADGHHLELAFQGQVWVSRMRVQLNTTTQTLASDDASAKLTLLPGDNAQEAEVKVEAKSTYEMV